MENKLTWNIDALQEWDKNPRTIDDKAFTSLKAKITRWGQFKPLLITETGVVVGGNMRLKAMRDLGITDIWVSIVSPKNEAEMLEIALADNELAGRWDRDELTSLLEQHKDEINFGDYELDFGDPISLSDILATDTNLDAGEKSDKEDDSEGELEHIKCPECGFEWEHTH